MAYLADTEASSIDVFFSYASDNERTIKEVLEEAKFGQTINGTIREYRDQPALVGSLSEGLEKQIRNCEVFIAFISDAYSNKSTPKSEFDVALKLLANPSPVSKLRELAVVVLDRKGRDWWLKRRPELKNWCADPVWLELLNAQGTKARSAKNDPDVIDQIQDLAKQLRERLKEPPKQENCSVIVLGHPLDDASKEIIDAEAELVTELALHQISVQSVPHGWAEQDPGSCPELNVSGRSSPPVFVQGVNGTTASMYIDFPENLDKQIVRVSGKSGNGPAEQAVQACQKVFWLPRGLVHRRFEKRAEEHRGGWRQNPTFCAAATADFGNWIARLLNAGRGSEPPLFTYERLTYEGVKRIGKDIICDEIIPEASKPLQDRYVPPQLEPMDFARESEFEKCISELTHYDCGIFALHNIGAEIDEKGTLPQKFVDNIRLYDRRLHERAPSVGLSLDRIIRLGIVATTMPNEHRYRYTRRLADDTLAQWRFVAVSLEHEGEACVVAEHVDQLQVELASLIGRQNASAPPRQLVL